MKKLIEKLAIRSIGLYFNMGKSFLNNAKDDLIKSNDLTLQTYQWIGDGPTVLLMHGWESNSFRWRPVVTALQKAGFSVVSFDAPAHGYSSGTILHVPLYADCSQKIIEAYQPEYIIGHSIGGMTMIYNQFKYKNAHVKKMVSLGAPSELSDFMRQYKNLLGLSNTLMTHLEAYFVTVFGFKFSDFSSPKYVKELGIPGLIIHDELDAVAPFWV